MREDATIADRSDHVEFLLAWWPAKARKAIAPHLFSAGAVEWIDRWAFGGAQLATEIAGFALSTMRYVDPAKLTLDQAKSSR